MKTIILIGVLTVLGTSSFAHEIPVAENPTLPQALGDFVQLLQADDLKSASEKWARPDAKLGDFWKNLRECHAKYDYNNWVTGQHKPQGDEMNFKVGGHSYGHMHIDWEKTNDGWRIVKVWICR
jgi:hypothetical protein